MESGRETQENQRISPWDPISEQNKVPEIEKKENGDGKERKKGMNLREIMLTTSRMKENEFPDWKSPPSAGSMNEKSPTSGYTVEKFQDIKEKKDFGFISGHIGDQVI